MPVCFLKFLYAGMVVIVSLGGFTEIAKSTQLPVPGRVCPKEGLLPGCLSKVHTPSFPVFHSSSSSTSSLFLALGQLQFYF